MIRIWKPSAVGTTESPALRTYTGTTKVHVLPSSVFGTDLDGIGPAMKSRLKGLAKQKVLRIARARKRARRLKPRGTT